QSIWVERLTLASDSACRTTWRITKGECKGSLLPLCYSWPASRQEDTHVGFGSPELASARPEPGDWADVLVGPRRDRGRPVRRPGAGPALRAARGPDRRDRRCAGAALGGRLRLRRAPRRAGGRRRVRDRAWHPVRGATPGGARSDTRDGYGDDRDQRRLAAGAFPGRAGPGRLRRAADHDRRAAVRAGGGRCAARRRAGWLPLGADAGRAD